MRASRPTTRTALPIPQVRATPLDPFAPCLVLFCGLDPADPFVSRQRSNIFPGYPCFWIELQRVFQVAWKIMDGTAGDVCLVSHQQHRTLSLGRADSAFVRTQTGLPRVASRS